MAQSTQELSPNDDSSAAFFDRGCCSFWSFPCFKSRAQSSDQWERVSTSDKEQPESGNGSWVRNKISTLQKVREWSELVAGPKWKTFIRRFNRTTGRSKAAKFQYDPLSYSLNFDEGPGQNGQFEDDRVLRDFSSRFSVVSGQNGQSKDGPSGR